jgi:hypothetical protein
MERKCKSGATVESRGTLSLIDRKECGRLEEIVLSWKAKACI